MARWLLLLALVSCLPAGEVPAGVVVLDDEIRLEPGATELVPIELRQRAAVIEVTYRCVEPSCDIEVGVLGPLARGSPRDERFEWLRNVSGEHGGAFRLPASRLGEYRILLKRNDAKGDAVRVSLKVALRFGEPGTTVPATATPLRRAVVVGVSLLFLVSAGLLAGRRLRAALLRRPAPPGQLPLF
jgi:hypothetical protein